MTWRQESIPLYKAFIPFYKLSWVQSYSSANCVSSFEFFTCPSHRTTTHGCRGSTTSSLINNFLHSTIIVIILRGVAIKHLYKIRMHFGLVTGKTIKEAVGTHIRKRSTSTFLHAAVQYWKACLKNNCTLYPYSQSGWITECLHHGCHTDDNGRTDRRSNNH